MPLLLLGIDDTDNPTSPGTGQLARRLTAELQRLGGTPRGITRHQFLVDPQIPYTGHNRGICVAVDWPGPIADLDFTYDLIADWSADGSDPGLCIAEPAAIPPAVTLWGERAMREVLTMPEALALAQQHHLPLRPLGGTGGGIIGALASVGLRAGGEIGRFVDMPGLRDLPETVTAQQLADLHIHVDHHTPPENSNAPRDSHAQNVYKTMGWVRPRLSKGRALWSVEWSNHDHAWVPLDRKTVHPNDPVDQG